MYIKCGNSNNRVDTVADYNGIAVRFRYISHSCIIFISDIEPIAKT